MTGISYEVRDRVMTGDGLLRQEPTMLKMATQLYAEQKAGPLCSGGLGSFAFMPITDFITEDGRRELKELFDKYCQDIDGNRREQYEVLREIYENPQESTGSAYMFLAQVNLHTFRTSQDFTEDLLPGNFVSLGVTHLHPLSRGSVHISSADPEAAPIIDPQYFSNPMDVEFMARHLRFVETIAETQALGSFLKPGGQRNDATAFVKDLDAAREYARDTALSDDHPACSCPMLPRDKGGVVNERLVVYGTNNLRIVDASAMPLIPRGNLQTSVYAVAERAADLIKEDHLFNRSQP
ncbi:hypothetical protein VTN77DRAFT_1726 [Rasamsonia byssochlamydoides]|uniref:uncharacterized protein n=1 Tax=Rasamsonia byssochlamydoides TaxID=89139 RepID=UPI003742985E